MVSTIRPPAITGVSAAHDATIMTVFPSVACTGFGRTMGSVLESIPVRICGVKVSYWLFGLLIAPFAALIYLLLKVTGDRYVVTNRSLQKWKSIQTTVRRGQVNLSDIAAVSIHQEPGQLFYKASDLYILGKGGERLMVLSGVPYAEIFRKTILEARDALVQTAAALETIRARR